MPSREDESRSRPSPAQGHSYIQPAPPHTPRIRRASWMSFCMIVTRLAWMAHRFVSSKRWTRNASADSCSANMACDCQRISSPEGLHCSAISRTCIPSGVSKLLQQHAAGSPAVLDDPPVAQRGAWRATNPRCFGISGSPSGLMYLGDISSSAPVVPGHQLRSHACQFEGNYRDRINATNIRCTSLALDFLLDAAVAAALVDALSDADFFCGIVVLRAGVLWLADSAKR